MEEHTSINLNFHMTLTIAMVKMDFHHIKSAIMSKIMRLGELGYIPSLEIIMFL